MTTYFDRICRAIDEGCVEEYMKRMEYYYHVNDMDTILRLASESKRADVIQICIAHKFTVNLNSLWIFQSFIKNNNTDIITLFLTSVAPVEKRCAIFEKAIEKGWVEIVQLLINHGVNINTDKRKYWKIALDSGYYQIIELFLRTWESLESLEYGIGINAFDGMAIKTRYIHSRYIFDRDLTDYLITIGADIGYIPADKITHSHQYHALWYEKTCIDKICTVLHQFDPESTQLTLAEIVLDQIVRRQTQVLMMDQCAEVEMKHFYLRHSDGVISIPKREMNSM